MTLPTNRNGDSAHSGDMRPLTNRDLAREDVARMMSRLSPDALNTLRMVADMKKRPPEEVLREEIENAIANQLPPVPIEEIIRLMGARCYELGYLVGSAKRFLRNLRGD